MNSESWKGVAIKFQLLNLAISPPSALFLSSALLPVWDCVPPPPRPPSPALCHSHFPRNLLPWHKTQLVVQPRRCLSIALYSALAFTRMVACLFESGMCPINQKCGLRHGHAGILKTIGRPSLGKKNVMEFYCLNEMFHSSTFGGSAH